MRASTSIIIVIVVCLAFLALYWFIGRSQLQKQVNQVTGEVMAAQTELETIDRMEAEIPQLLAQLPIWQRQYELFRSAIPSEVDDHRFLSAIIDQLDKSGAKFISSEMALGGQWLEGVSESQFEQLQAAGLDVDVAKKIRVAFYSLSLEGDYKDILNTFEGLKRYGRLYTIDQVLGPAGGAAGAVTRTLDASMTPVEMTGRIYYGIPENSFNVQAIQRQFAEKGSGMAARATANSIKDAGQQLNGRKRHLPPAAPNDEAPEEEGAQAGSNLNADAGEAG